MSKESLIKKFEEFSTIEHHEETTSINDKVFIIDGTNSFIKFHAAISTTDANGNPIGGIVGFLKNIASFSKIYKPSRIVCVFDGVGGSQRRRAIYKEYKEGSKPSSKLNRTYESLSTTDEQKSMQWQMMKLIEILKNLPVTILVVDNVEADDVIAHLSTYIKEEKSGNSIIMSTDKDFLQLIDSNVSVWNSTKKIMYKPENVINEYQIHPNNFLMFRMLDGDTSDNISGIKGMGLKTIQKLFPEFLQEQKLTIDNLLLLAAKYPKYKAAINIINSKNILERNKQLMDLSNVQMSTHSKISVLNQFDNIELKLNKTNLIKIFTQSGLIDAIPNLDNWLQESFIPLLRFNIK